MVTKKQINKIKEDRKHYLKEVVNMSSLKGKYLDDHLESFKNLVIKFKTEENVALEHAVYLAQKDFYIHYNIMGKPRKDNRYKTNKIFHTPAKVKTNDEYLADYKVFIVGDNQDCSSWTNMEIVDNLEDANLVMFTGGADVDPVHYGENLGKYTYIDEVRDEEEIEIYKEAIDQGKKIIGICRGAQLSCVMAGGKLIQDCLGHNNCKHDVLCTWTKGKTYDLAIPGDHHQMMYPFNLDTEDYRIVGYNKKPFSLDYMNGDDEFIKVPKDFREPEIVIFPKINALAIQGHPEWDAYNTHSNQKLRELLLTFMRITKFKTNKEINETVA